MEMQQNFITNATDLLPMNGNATKLYYKRNRSITDE
jgi:hypothetical protein